LPKDGYLWRKQIKHCKIKTEIETLISNISKLLILEKAYKEQDGMKPLYEFLRNEKNNSGANANYSIYDT